MKGIHTLCLLNSPVSPELASEPHVTKGACYYHSPDNYSVSKALVSLLLSFLLHLFLYCVCMCLHGKAQRMTNESQLSRLRSCGT